MAKKCWLASEIAGDGYKRRSGDLEAIEKTRYQLLARAVYLNLSELGE
jgi:hypothetical protein